MNEWIDTLARELGLEPLSQDETTRLLNTARDVAHRVERRLTPLSTFLMGVAVGTRTAVGHPRSEVAVEVLATLESLLPEATE